MWSIMGSQFLFFSMRNLFLSIWQLFTSWEGPQNPGRIWKSFRSSPEQKQRHYSAHTLKSFIDPLNSRPDPKLWIPTWPHFTFDHFSHMLSFTSSPFKMQKHIENKLGLKSLVLSGFLSKLSLDTFVHCTPLRQTPPKRTCYGQVFMSRPWWLCCV